MMTGRPILFAAALGFTLTASPTLAQISSPPAAETLGSYFGSSIENRTVVTFKISDEAAQKLLPVGWIVSPITQGPAKGANLSITFAERMATFDASGKPAGGEEATVIFSIPAKRDSETAFAIVVAFSDTQTAPGFFYKTGKPADVAVERTLHLKNLKGMVQENWSVKSESGETVRLQIGYERSQPVRVQNDSRNVSTSDGNVRRTYRIDQGLVVLKSLSSGTDQTKNLDFSASGGVLAAIFDGSEKIISAVSLPWYTRQMYVPATQ